MAGAWAEFGHGFGHRLGRAAGQGLGQWIGQSLEQGLGQGPRTSLHTGLCRGLGNSPGRGLTWLEAQAGPGQGLGRGLGQGLGHRLGQRLGQDRGQYLGKDRWQDCGKGGVKPSWRSCEIGSKISLNEVVTLAVNVRRFFLKRAVTANSSAHRETVGGHKPTDKMQKSL